MKLKLLQLNIWHGGELIDNVISFIQKENPDIITCQEVQNGDLTGVPRSLTTLKTFAEELDYSYVFSPQILWCKEPHIEQGLATFSRFPIELKDTVFFDTSYRYYPMVADQADWEDYPTALQYSVVQSPQGSLNIYNVHGIWGLDGEDNPSRLKMSEIIVSQIQGKENVIVAGDFNMFPNTQSIRAIERHLTSVFGTELPTTHNLSRKPPGYGKGPVDMVFVSTDIKVLNHFCPQVDISDHMPLVAVLEV